MMVNCCYKCMELLAGGVVCPRCGRRVDAPVTNLPHQLAPGTVLAGRYLVGEVLGQGGFGITYIGRNTTLGMRIAIKEYYPSGYATRNTTVSNQVTVAETKNTGFIAEGKEKFLVEARALAKFDGLRGVVGVRDFFEANGTAYIIMEYLDGEDLRGRLKRGLFTADQAFELMTPVMDALERIHAEKVVHRDISPDNIMILRDGSPKLMDFGAARVVDYSDGKSISIMLKPGYAPEEQYRARGSQGPWTDVYALCATIYKCITGVTPENSLERAYNDTIKWPSEMGFAISEVQEAVLKKGLAVRAEDRFWSIADLRKALETPLSQWPSLPKETRVSAPAASAPPNAHLVEEEVIEQQVTTGPTSMLASDDSTTLFADDSTVLADEHAAVAPAPAPTAYYQDVRQVPPPAAGNVRERQGRGIPKLLIAAVVVALLACVLITTFIMQTANANAVSFESAGGTAVGTVWLGEDEALDELPGCEREGYVFGGWYWDAGHTRAVEAPVKVDGDYTLYALWQVPVTYHTERGELESDTLLVAEGATVEPDDLVTLSCEGYTFNGWFYDEGTTTPVDASFEASEGIDLYAGWSQKQLSYTIQYVEKSTGKSIKKKTTVKNAGVDGDKVTAKAVQVSGYTLLSNSKKAVKLSLKGENTVTFYYKKKVVASTTSSPSTPSYTPSSSYSGGGSSSGGSSSSTTSDSGIDWDDVIWLDGDDD